MNYSTNDGFQSESPHEHEVLCASNESSDLENGVFPGDLGHIPHETRRVLVQLLLGPAVDGRRQGNLWAVLLRDEEVLRERLHELFLDLVVDYEQKVAFTRQVAADGIEIPVLLRRTNLTFLESVLLLFLRQRLTQAETQLERAVVSWKDIVEHLSVYERSGNVDHARFDKQCHGAIEKVKKLNLIQKIRGTEDRFEVSPTLKLLFPAEEIQALTRTYQALTHEHHLTHSGETDDVTDGADMPGDDDE